MLINNDKEEFNHVNLILTFCKHCGDDFAGLVSRKMLRLADKFSYKIPQMETSVAPPINVPTPPVMSHQVQVQGRVQAPQGVVAMEKKKDIVAEAASKIFEDDSAKKATPAAQSATSAATTSAALPTAVKSEPGVATAGPSTSAGPSAIKSAPIVTPRAGPVSRGRGSGRPSNRQHVMPRIQ